jgi:hypothetical protein
MDFLTGLFIIVLAGIAAGTVGEIAKAIGRRGGAARDIADLRALVEQNALALDEAQETLAGQATQLADLQERVDFAERILAQVRERKALGAGEG